MDYYTKIDGDYANLKDPIMLVGLPGIGLVGKIAIEYLAVNTKAKKIGVMGGALFPPIVVVNKTGHVEKIENDIYLLREKKNDFIIYTGDVQPTIGESESAKEHYLFATKIIDVAKKLGVKSIYTFAGIDIGDSRITKKPKLYYATNSKELAKEVEKHKVKSAKEDLTISGASGMVVALSDIDSICILPETSEKLVYGDYESSKKILQFINNHFEIDINLKDIKKESQKISKAFKQIVDELKSITKSQNKEDKTDLKYVR